MNDLLAKVLMTGRQDTGCSFCVRNHPWVWLHALNANRQPGSEAQPTIIPAPPHAIRQVSQCHSVPAMPLPFLGWALMHPCSASSTCTQCQAFDMVTHKQCHNSVPASMAMPRVDGNANCGGCARALIGSDSDLRLYVGVFVCQTRAGCLQALRESEAPSDEHIIQWAGLRWQSIGTACTVVHGTAVEA